MGRKVCAPCRAHIKKAGSPALPLPQKKWVYFFIAGHFTFLPPTVTSSLAFLPLHASESSSLAISPAKATGVSGVTANVAATRAVRSLVMIFPLWLMTGVFGDRVISVPKINAQKVHGLTAACNVRPSGAMADVA